MWPLWLVEMSLQHIPKNSPGLLPKPAKFEKNPPNGYRVIRKTKCGAGGAGGAGSSPIHKQASLAGRLIKREVIYSLFLLIIISVLFSLFSFNTLTVHHKKLPCVIFTKKWSLSNIFTSTSSLYFCVLERLVTKSRAFCSLWVHLVVIVIEFFNDRVIVIVFEKFTL